MCISPIDGKRFEYSMRWQERGGDLLLRHGLKQDDAYVDKL